MSTHTHAYTATLLLSLTPLSEQTLSYRQRLHVLSHVDALRTRAHLSLSRTNARHHPDPAMSSYVASINLIPMPLYLLAAFSFTHLLA